MKLLPEFPNLQHLRQQAKDLLPQLRQSRGEATLATAQTVVAEQYGFRTWAELKAEVDRRRGQSARTLDPVRAAAIADAFGLGTTSSSTPGVAVERRFGGEVWSLPTERGRWWCTELFPWTSGAVEDEVRLVTAAIERGVVAPRPVRSPWTGSVVVELDADGSRWRVHEWLGVGPALSKPGTPPHAAAAGRALAVLDALAMPPAPGSVVPLWTLWRRPASDWEALATRARSSGVRWADDLSACVPGLEALKEAVVDPRDPNRDAILGNVGLGPTAVRATGRDTIAVIDWDHVSPSPPAWGLGGLLASWAAGTAPDDFNAAAVAAAASAYGEVGGVLRGWDLSMFAGHVTAWCNWLFTRVEAALGSPDPIGRSVAMAEVPGLLAAPVRVDQLERVLAVAAGAARVA